MESIKGQALALRRRGKILLFVIRDNLKLLRNFFRMVNQLGEALWTDHSIKPFVAENDQRTLVFANAAVEAILLIELLTHGENPFVGEEWIGAKLSVFCVSLCKIHNSKGNNKKSPDSVSRRGKSKEWILQM